MRASQIGRQVRCEPGLPHAGLPGQDGYRNVGNPIKLSRTPPAVRSKPRTFGADTRAVLADHGLAPAEIDKLIESGIAFDKPKK